MVRFFLPVLSGIIAGVILVEIILRLVLPVPWQEKFPPSKVRPDPDIGWTMLPGDIHYTYDKLVRLNRLGFRGPEVAEKKENEYRILAVGDSHVYGQGLEDGQLLTNQLQSLLIKYNQSCKYNVINMGVRAYSINNELAMLQKNGLKLKPDHVIWFFFIDDFRQSDIRKWYDRFADYDWYMFDLLDKPTQQVLRSWRLRQIARHSSLAMWAHDTVGSLGSNTNRPENVEFKLLEGINDDDVRLKISIVENYLGALRKLSDLHGFTFTLVVIPDVRQLFKEYPSNLYQNVLIDYAKTEAIDYLDLLPFLKKEYEESNRLPVIPFDGHYNAEGHYVIANAVFKHLNNLPSQCN
ncbi:MAG: SGNH/GDSL hydrolase family protein [Gammaproteobacteria bacterium]